MALFGAVEAQLAARGVLVKQGTLVDATLVDTQVRRPKGGATEAGSPRDPDTAWARRGRQARFGYKLHLGVDADSELMRRALLTPAQQTPPPTESGGAPSPRPDQTGAAAGGAPVRHVETLLRLPAGALPRPSPPYHRDVFKLLAYNLRRAVRVLTGAPASP